MVESTLPFAVAEDRALGGDALIRMQCDKQNHFGRSGRRLNSADCASGAAVTAYIASRRLPSNHTFNFFAMALFMSFFLRGWGWRTALIGVSLLVAISRIYLAKHYPSQVGVGLLLGVSYGFVLGWLVVRFIPYLRTLHQRAGGAIRIKKGEWL
ncbi:phosphatase PAP2 family protein [Candidatus Reidiella endopervernicosa]|uniref:phosphatase PAP2 family protein n=1 Tax=Candidatus Reidiella endopervernicosa TaxID=2738883 RepID=UPI003B968971